MSSPSPLLTVLIICLKQILAAGRPNDNEAFAGAPPIQYSSLTGPAFVNSNASTVRVVEGTTAVLPCVIKNLHNYTVSWVRGRDIRLLTTGSITYTSDTRFVSFHPLEGQQWFLKIHYVRKTDDGYYLCQVSTTPPITLEVNLKVQEAIARVFPGPEVYVQTGSRLEVVCQVEGCPIPALLSWTRGGNALYTPMPHSFQKELGDTTTPITQLKLVRESAQATDSGMYSCTSTCTQPINATVHVLRGEELAAMQHHNSCPRAEATSCIALLLVMWIMTFLPWDYSMECCRCHSVLTRRHRHPLNCYLPAMSIYHLKSGWNKGG